jgi:hypothetical protein
LIQLISLGETRLVEFKREWWAISQAEGKAAMARQVLAMANTVGRDDLAAIIIGVDDERRGRNIFSVEDPPVPESIAQILGIYVHPPVDAQCRHYQLPGGQVSTIAVFSSNAAPHTAFREFPGVLSTRDVYVRRDKQVGVLSVAELEQMLIAKNRSHQPTISAESIEIGFTSVEQIGDRTVVARIRNMTATPLTDVCLHFDVSMMRDPELCSRIPSLLGVTLGAGEVREATLRLDAVVFYDRPDLQQPDAPRQVYQYPNLRHVAGRAWNVVSTVRYRTTTGIFATRSATLALLP